MSYPEIIKTECLLLEPFSKIFLTETYVGWLNDPEVVRFSEQRHRVHTLETTRKYIESFKNSANRIWAICVRNGDIGHIGNITAHINTNNNIADIGILIGRKDVWGKGFGTEAWCGVCDYLINTAGIRKITGGTLATNTGMLKVMQKAGMIEDGHRTRHYEWEGQQVDMIHLAKFK